MLDDFVAFLKLVDLLKFCAPAGNHIDAARIAVFIDDVGGEFHIIVVNETTGTHQESIEFVLGIEFFDGIKEAADDVVSAGGLSSAEDDANIHFLAFCHVARNELDEWHAIGVGEEFLDFLLVVNTLSRSTLLHFDGSLQSLWQFGLIGCPSLLQCAFFHN